MYLCVTVFNPFDQTFHALRSKHIRKTVFITVVCFIWFKINATHFMYHANPGWRLTKTVTYFLF